MLPMLLLLALVSAGDLELKAVAEDEVPVEVIVPRRPNEDLPKEKITLLVLVALPLAATGGGVVTLASVALLVGPPAFVLPTVPVARLGLVLEDRQRPVQLLRVVDVEGAVAGLAKGAGLVLQRLLAIVLVIFVVVKRCLSAGQEQKRGHQETARGGAELHGASRNAEVCGDRSLVVDVVART